MNHVSVLSQKPTHIHRRICCKEASALVVLQITLTFFEWSCEMVMEMIFHPEKYRSRELAIWESKKVIKEFSLFLKVHNKFAIVQQRWNTRYLFII